MPTLTVDGIEVEVPAGATVLQACEAAGKEIPRFCYHERLSIAGNCRMCLVEVKPGPPKPQASCALPAADKQEIRTDSAMVKKAREGVMEFLLINHPLDCPICDQGGECDLQDQSMAYGKGHSRFDENKRAVTEKYMGPIVKTQMTRCIQCTRCVRFAEEVAGVEEIGAIYRGENMQITSYLEHAVTSELSGNVVDLCPVGALTSKPYAFEARPWELHKTPGIDVMDAVGTNVRLDSRGRQVLRSLPRINEDVNEEWASDKTRHAVDGLVRNRIDKPYIRVDGKLKAATWEEAFKAIAKAADGLTGNDVAGLAGDLAEVESVYALKQLLAAYGSTLHEARVDGALYDVANPASYRFNPTIAGVENAKAILLVGANPRWEAPLVNTRIRKAIKKGAKVYAVGPEVDLTYKAEWLGSDLSALNDLPEALAKAEDVIVIAGMGACAIEGGYGAARQTAAALGAGFGLLHTAAGRVGALDVGFAAEGGFAAVVQAAPKLVFLLGVDETDLSGFANSFKVYIGTHGDRGAHAADVILPGATYVEKPGTWVNMEGRVQRAERAVFPVGDAREDWTILRALSAVLGKTLPFDSLAQLRAKIAADHPGLAEEGNHLAGALDPAPKGGDVSGAIVYPIADFYLTNPIARSSPTMQRCSAELIKGETFAEAAE
ncbi:NADH-quinone oxidoreductase subunit G [Sphingomonas sp. CGMCC 1.13654]|uniref:NADH-quinone oxidoreductase n=1 Tax=Sphingomonas chungangi TaxID=2683589 RepID=A0A838L9D3_9SPHN|nr:NADH-quinone oxidoreductase subunit NuoG [Sphingomonas chungangi]MBA2935794.1 NADH-quinone oxidoreductase subunit G [Sphingomonas chungangi]MVW54485.1 NADH-quinone oxidoreductase subunit G [Sphingomonas chungangi]